MALFKSKGKHAQKTDTQAMAVQSGENGDAGKLEVPEIGASKEGEASAEVAAGGAAGSAAVDEATNEDTVAGAGNLELPSVEKPTLDVPPVVAATQQPMHPDHSPTPSISSGQFPAPGQFGDAYLPALPDGVVLRKKRGIGKVLGIVFGIIIGVLLIAYIAGAIVFMNFFLPRTTIAGEDVSMMSNADVAQMIDDKVSSYSLDIVGNGFSYRTTAADIGMSVDSQGVVDAMHSNLNAWAWPVLLFQDSHDESGVMEVSYKKQNYDYQIINAINAYNKDAVAPVDATISYDEAAKKFKIVPEVAGTQYDAHIVLSATEDALNTLEPKVKLTSDHLVQPKVLSTDERLVNSAELATGLVSAHVTLTMAGQTVSEISGDNLSSFIRLDDALGVTLDEGALDQWVTDLSNSFDTVGSERTYTRPDGKVITISGGAYGWSTDSAGLKDQVIAAVKAGEKKTIDIPCEQTAAVFTGKGQPDWGNRYIDVDLSEQYVRFYDNGNIIWESACVSGSPDGEHNTWPGVWYITNKESPSKLIGYLPSGEKEYETTVSFWMAFEGNGIGLHDATWQPAFGGSMYASGYGSHGCVNLPYDAAASLYEISAVGDPVIAHY